jgi:hypothetical protein
LREKLPLSVTCSGQRWPTHAQSALDFLRPKKDGNIKTFTDQ